MQLRIDWIMGAVLACAAGTLPLQTGAQTLEAYLLPKCPVTAPDVTPKGAGADPLTGIVVQMLITKGLDMAGTALAEAAKDKVTTVQVPHSAPVPYYQMAADASLSVSDKVGCLVFLGKGSTNAQTPWQERLKKGFADLSIATDVSVAPDFYFEAKLEGSKTTRTLLVTPAMLYVRKPLMEGYGWIRRKGKDYVITASFVDEGTDTAFGALNFVFNDVEPDTAWLESTLDEVTRGKKLAGWPAAMLVPKLPASESLNEAQGRQKTRIAPYLEANVALKREVIKPLERDTIESSTKYKTAVDDLCAAIASETPKVQTSDKGEKPTAPSDPRCPYSVWLKRVEADKVANAEAASQTLTWARSYYTRYCKGESMTAKEEVKGPNGAKTEVELCGLPTPNPQRLGAFRVKATIVETAEAHKFVNAVASAFEKNKETLATRLNDELNPVRREELAKAEDATNRDARQKLQLAMLKVGQLEASYADAAGSSASARKAIEIQLVQAKIDANAAARVAASVSPYPEYD